MNNITITYVLLCIIILLLFTIYVHHVYLYRRGRLFELAKQFDGPEAHPIVGNIFNISAHNTYQKLLHYSEKYSPTYRLWMGSKLFVVFTRPEDFETILKHPAATSKSTNYNVFESFFGHGLLNSDRETWRRHRKIMNSAFNPTTLQKYVKTFYSKSIILVEKLNKYKNREEFDVYNYIGMATMDMVTSTVIGTDVNIQINERTDLIETLQEIKQLAHNIMVKPLYWNKYMQYLSPGYYKFVYLHTSFEKLVEELICKKEEKFTEGESDTLKERRQMSFLGLAIASKIHGFNILDASEVRDETLTLVITGTDTTTFIISCALILLGIYQDVQNKVVQEMRDIFGDNIYRKTTYEDVREMSYLSQVIKETLRLYQPIPVIGREIQGEEIIVGGHTLPEGSCVLLLLFASHRNSKYFPNPGQFNPDRFSFSNRVNRHQFDFIPFSGGHRNCIGQLYARLQMKTIISTILKYYEILPSSSISSSGAAEELSMRLTLHLTGGYHIKIKPRKW